MFGTQSVSISGQAAMAERWEWTFMNGASVPADPKAWRLCMGSAIDAMISNSDVVWMPHTVYGGTRLKYVLQDSADGVRVFTHIKGSTPCIAFRMMPAMSNDQFDVKLWSHEGGIQIECLNSSGVQVAEVMVNTGCTLAEATGKIHSKMCSAGLLPSQNMGIKIWNGPAAGNKTIKKIWPVRAKEDMKMDTKVKKVKKDIMKKPSRAP